MKQDNRTVKLVVKGKEEEMSMYTFVRWACLIEAVETIHEKAQQLGISEKDDSWIKPNAIQKYIEDRTPSMSHEIDRELERPTLRDFRPKWQDVFPHCDERREAA